MKKVNAVNISVIVPVYNEEKNIYSFYQEIKPVLTRLKERYELIFVNDGSTDKSQKYIEDIAAKDRHIILLEFSRNYGQTAAIAAGINKASGKIIIFLDSDGQNDPSDIPLLLAYIKKGYDVVSGWRKYRKDPFFSKKVPSYFANLIISKVIGIKLHDYGCTLKAYRKDILNKFILYGEMHRLIPAYAALSGAKIIEIPVTHRPRMYGKSHYGLMRTLKLLFDLTTIKFLNDFCTKPLYLFGTVGIIIFFFGISIFLFVCVRVLFFSGGWISPLILLSGLMVILSFQFILIGLLAEIIVRIYFESSHKLPYIIKKKLNL